MTTKYILTFELDDEHVAIIERARQLTRKLDENINEFSNEEDVELMQLWDRLELHTGRVEFVGNLIDNAKPLVELPRLEVSHA